MEVLSVLTEKTYRWSVRLQTGTEGGSDREEEGPDMELESIGTTNWTLCKKRKNRKRKRQIVLCMNRHQTFSCSSNAESELQQTLDTYSSDIFITKVANFAPLGNICENYNVFKYEYDLLLHKFLQTHLSHIIRNIKLLT